SLASPAAEGEADGGELRFNPPAAMCRTYDHKEFSAHASLRNRFYRASRSKRAGARDDRAVPHDGDRPGRPDSPARGLGTAAADLPDPEGAQGPLRVDEHRMQRRDAE